MGNEKHDEVWAVETERVRTFFDEQLSDLSCDVTVIPMPDKSIGPITMPQTRIIIAGDDADELYRRFTLKFMTAGG